MHGIDIEEYGVRARLGGTVGNLQPRRNAARLGRADLDLLLGRQLQPVEAMGAMR